MSDAATRAADPTTSGEELAALAHEHPELHAVIARHPSAYPELLSWIAEHGDASSRAIIAERAATAPTAATPTVALPTTAAMAPVTAAPASRRGLVLAIGGAVLAAVAAVVVTLLVVSSLTPTGTPTPAPEADGANASESPTPEPEPETVTALLVADLPKLPIHPVTPVLDEGYDVTSVQRFANDVVAGDTEALVRKCWTFAPETIRDRYASEAGRGALIDAFSNVGMLGQTGAIWTGRYVDLYFSWPELQSTYACPQVRILNVDDVYGPADAAWLVHRLAGRALGTPVASGDVATTYFLHCDHDFEPWPFTPDGITPVTVESRPIYEAAIALDGHPINLTALEPHGYYLVWSPEVEESLVVQGFSGVACVGEAR